MPGRTSVTSLRKIVIALAASALAAAVGVPALASAATSAPPAANSDLPPSTVESFAYPNAEKIFKEKKIKLVRGDGRITLADCDSTGSQIKVMAVTDDNLGTRETYCFQATAKTGYLSLEVPRVFYLKTSDHPISADLTADNATTTVNVAKNTFKSVGEGTIGGAQSVLVELRITG
jgi:hypothetical protein